MTIFLTTHYMEEAAQADFITIMDHGKVLAKGTPRQLRDRHATDLLKLVPIDSVEMDQHLTALSISYAETGGAFQIPLRHTLQALDIIDGCRTNISGFEVISGTMDDVFLNLTGKEVRGS